MPRPTHFEIHAADIEQAIRFYSSLFGWEFQSRGDGTGFHMIITGPPEEPGINGGLVPRMGPNPDPTDATPVIAFPCTIVVDDLEASVAKAMALGGAIALPKMRIPGVGWLAYIKDNQSNIIGLTQPEARDARAA